MKMVVKWLLTGCAALLLATSSFAETYTAGKEYVVLSNPQPTDNADKIEVVELFWYGCPHCYRLEPFIAQWQEKTPDDVEFIQMPAVLGKGWELLAKGFYTAELLNVSDKTHTALFEALHVDKKKIKDEASLQKIFAEQFLFLLTEQLAVRRTNKKESSFRINFYYQVCLIFNQNFIILFTFFQGFLRLNPIGYIQYKTLYRGLALKLSFTRVKI